LKVGSSVTFLLKDAIFSGAGMVQNNGKTPVFLFLSLQYYIAIPPIQIFSCQQCSAHIPVLEISQAFMYLLENHGDVESSQKLVLFV